MVYYRLSICNEWCCGGVENRWAQDGSSGRDGEVNKTTKNQHSSKLASKGLIEDIMNKCKPGG